MNASNPELDEHVTPAPDSSLDEFSARVVALLAEQTQMPVGEIHADTRLHELGDSLDRMEAVMKLEEEFEVSIPDPHVEQLQTVGQLTDYLRARCDGRSRAASA